jgi:hypothetical protein
VDLKESNRPSTGVTFNGEVSAPPQAPVVAPAAVSASASALAPAASLQCDECAAPVAEEQRYCVVCGAHRRHVSDPAARYLSRVGARSRTTRTAATARRPRGSSRLGGIGVAVVLALIPAGAAVGVLAGRSSNNDDASLIRALSRQQAADRVTAASGSSGATASASTTKTGGHSRAGGSDHSKKSGHGSSRKGHGTKGGKSSASSTKATSISTKAPSAAQKATGAKVTQKVQKSTGKSYVSGQSGLPSTVVVP